MPLLTNDSFIGSQLRALPHVELSKAQFKKLLFCFYAEIALIFSFINFSTRYTPARINDKLNK